jgi:deferrochelatase/peroxidase EfeB
MTHALVTIIAPLATERVEPVRALIEALSDPANPAQGAIADDLARGGVFVHFASMHALACSDGKSGIFVLEFSADGEERGAIDEIARRIGPRLKPILEQCAGWRQGQQVVDFLRGHQVRVSQRLGGTVGLVFAGTPGQSVADILREDDLARCVARLLASDEDEQKRSPLARLMAVRESLRSDPEQRWALDVPPPPLPSPGKEPGTWGKVGKLALPGIGTFLWPLLLVVVPLSLWLAWPADWQLLAPARWRDLHFHWALVPGVLINLVRFLLQYLLYLVLGLVIPVLLAVLRFAGAEAQDWLSDRAPPQPELEEMFARENATGYVQNHMVSQTVLKPGLLRWLSIRLAFWVIAKFTAFNPKPGHLGDIGTIHFARWVQVPGKRDLLFFSNYGGSWESYLEDFITKAHAGLTAVWSNTVGFPRTRFLFLDGATDGERFKRYARQSMLRTSFWYSAYPSLTTANIRANALIRRGVAAAMTDDEAVRWLALFGSSPRPVEKLESSQIQSLLFGGMGFKPYGCLLAIDLGADLAENRQLLADLLPFIAFNDGRYLPATEGVLTFTASASGLARLGLPEDGLATFPGAFLAGMTGPGRPRILGDLGKNDPGGWAWGRDGVDLALLVYGGSADSVDSLSSVVEGIAAERGAVVVHRLALPEIPSDPALRKEPFGFLDGVSQPAIRGTYRGLRNDDPIHLVEPGEFVLGYPDNRGNVPPGPTLSALHDPDCVLPIAGSDQGFSEVTVDNPRLIGQNGSFLVIRQLEQHVGAFKTFCKTESERLVAHFQELPIEKERPWLEEFIGAKLIGRWTDGSSLVRFPYISASRLKFLTNRDPTALASRPKSNPAEAFAAPIDASEKAAPPPIEEPPKASRLKAALKAVTSLGRKEPAEERLPIRPDNDFLFGTEDPQGLRCPYGAHVRRANPRDSLSPGSQDQIDISNRHRILRVGRLYEEGGVRKGLLFMCLNGDLERQFEFIQQTWMGSTKFHGLSGEVDPIAGAEITDCDGFTVPTRHGPVALNRLPQFVTVRGGGYFFVPGRQLLQFLSKPLGAAD